MNGDANRVWLFSLVLVAFSVDYVYLQTTTVSGVIKRTDNDQGIAEVRIYIVSPDSIQKHKGTSDGTGNFAIAVPHGSTNTFLFQHPSFYEEKRSLEASTVYTIMMEPRPGSEAKPGPSAEDIARDNALRTGVNNNQDSQQSKSSNDDDENNQNLGIIIGVLLFVVLLACVAICAFLKRRKKKPSQENATGSSANLDEPPPEEAGPAEPEPIVASGASKVSVSRSPSRTSKASASASPAASRGSGSSSFGAGNMVSADGGSFDGGNMVSADGESFDDQSKKKSGPGGSQTVL